MLFTFFFITLLHNFFTFNENITFMGVGWVGTSIIHLLFVYQAVFDDQFVPIGLTAALNQAENPGPQSLGGEIQT